MLVGICQIELFLPGCHSLKEKRGVLQRLKQRIRQKFNYSVAEVGGQDTWQTALFGLAMVASEQKQLDQTFEKVLDLIERDGRAVIVNVQQEVV